MLTEGRRSAVGTGRLAAGRPRAWWMISRGGIRGPEVLTLGRSGGAGRTPALFSFEEEAELYLHLGGLAADGWRVRESAPGEVVSVLLGPCAGARLVALDPLPGMEADGALGLVCVRKERFVGRLLGGAPLADAGLAGHGKAGVSGNGGGPARVLLADGHAMFAQALSEMLEGAEAGDGRALEVVAIVGAEGAAPAAEGERPDVVVTEVDGVPGAAAERVRRLLALRPPPGVVVLTRYANPRLVRAVLGVGAAACVHKGAAFADLLVAVGTAARAAGNGRGDGDRDETDGERATERVPFGSPLVVMPEGVLGRAFGADGESDGCPLSGRELEVLRLAALGMPNRRIASSLHLSEATVKRHLANAYPKMGVGCRGEAVVRALSEGWISADEILAAPPATPGRRSPGA